MDCNLKKGELTVFEFAAKYGLDFSSVSGRLLNLGRRCYLSASMNSAIPLLRAQRPSLGLFVAVDGLIAGHRAASVVRPRDFTFSEQRHER